MRESRSFDSMRPIKIETGYTEYAEGSVLISFGRTRVLCTASVEESVPSFVRAKGPEHGWLTAEYSMLPRATHTRHQRDRNKTDGRTIEIQRLIGRSLRSVVNLSKLGPRSITIDCDVIQADGGTRTAAISGAWVALMLALKKVQAKGLLAEIPVSGHVAAVSVGKCQGQHILDLEYVEDSQAELDMNIIMTDAERFIEIQGTGEEHPFDEEELHTLIALAKKGVRDIVAAQRAALGG
jgi:ribonuclease PH